MSYTAETVVYCGGIDQMGRRVKCSCGYVGPTITQCDDETYGEYDARVELARKDHLMVKHGQAYTKGE